MFNPNYIKGMMEHGYAGAGKLQGHVEWLWGWDAVDTRFVDANDWNEVYEVYVQDKYDLGTKDWFDENSPWARQTMIARMLESTRKGYWTPSEEIKTALAKEYQQSVEKFGPCCCLVCCGNPLLDTYTKGMLQPGAEEKPQSSSSSSRHTGSRHKYSEPVVSTSERATNQTESSYSGVGETRETVENPSSPKPKTSETRETSETGEKVEGKVMTETSSTLPVSGAPLMAIIMVIAIIALVGAGFWLRRR